MKSRITLSDMEFYGYIGCFDEEKVIGTRYAVDIEMLCDIRDAAIDDDLTQTINYQAVYCIVKELMQEKANLLETMAHRIMATLRREFPAIEEISVSISKLNPMLAAGGKIKAVTIRVES